MSLSATLDGHRITSLTVHVLWVGAWFADVTLDAQVDLSGAVEIALGSLALKGTILPAHTAQFAFETKCRVMGGAAGWMRQLPAKTYRTDSGVKSSTIVNDLIRETGETIGSFSPTVERVGVTWVRKAGYAGDLLSHVASSWWVDFNGVTQIGPRAQSEIAGTYEVLNYDAKAKRAIVGVDDPSAISIGSVLRDDKLPAPVIVRELIISMRGSTLRLECFGTEQATATMISSRLARMIRSYVRECLREYAYLRSYRYRVTDFVGKKVSAQIIAKGTGMPDVVAVPIYPGVGGVHGKPAKGSTIIVQFIEGNPAMPMVVGFESPDASGFVAQEIYLQAGTSGASPTEHATSIEAVVNLLAGVLGQLPASALPSLPLPAPPIVPSATVIAVLNAAIAYAAAPATGTILAYKTAITAGLSKLPNATGLLPGIGWPKVMGG